MQSGLAAGRPLRAGSAACVRYSEAAELRERLRAAKEAAEEAAGRRAQQQASVEPRRFRLGQRVAHAVHGYRGAICGCARCRSSGSACALSPVGAAAGRLQTSSGVFTALCRFERTGP